MKLFLPIILLTLSACIKKELIKSQSQPEKTAVKNSITGDEVAARSIEKYVNVTDGLNLRSKPEKKAKKLATLRRGERVKILLERPEIIVIDGVSGKWTQITDGRVTGWCFGGFLSEQKPPDLAVSPAEDNLWSPANSERLEEHIKSQVEKCMADCQGNGTCEKRCADGI